LLLGGGWTGVSDYCRASQRNAWTPVFVDYSVGFRAARNP